MSKIEELIAELSPEGVPFRHLGDVARTVAGLSGKSKDDFSNGNARFVSYKNAFANTAVDQLADDFVKVAEGERQNSLRKGDIVITGSSESVVDVGMSSVVTSEPLEPLYLNSFCFAVRFNDPSILLPGFSKYLFRGESVRAQIRRSASGVTRINIAKARFLRIRIPVPPLETQRAILEILDPFTELQVGLESALLREKDARREQLAVYRNQILNEIDSYDSVPLHEVADFFNAKAHEKLVDPSGTVALLTSRFISTDGRMARYVNSADVLTPALVDDVALVMSDLPNGRALARTFFVDADGKYAANQRVCLLRARDRGIALPRFLFHVLNRNASLLAYDNGMDQTHLKKGYIQELRIGLPPVEEQRRLVAVLDELDTMFGELIGTALPTELEGRRKQYEYYRDKLLTFEEAAT